MTWRFREIPAELRAAGVVRLGGDLPAPFEHTEERYFGALAEGSGHFEAWLQSIEAAVEFFQRIHFHEAAIGAGAAVGGAGDECFVGQFPAQAVEHAAFGDDDEALGGVGAAVLDHFFG